MKSRRREARKRAALLVEEVEHQSKFLTGLKTILGFFAREAYKSDLEKFVPGLNHFFGTPLEVLYVVGDEIGKKFKKDTGRLYDLLKALWENGSREERLIVAHVLGKFALLDPPNVTKFVWGAMKDISNWELCDAMATKAFGPILLARSKELVPKTRPLIRSPQKWVRRMGVLSFISLAHQDEGFRKVESILKLFDPVMKDADPDVKKAVSWVIRDFTPKSRQAVIRYLTKWGRGATSDTEWIVRNASTRLPKAERAKLLALIKTTGKGNG